MRLLLDTHVLLWAIEQPERIGGRTRAALEDGDNQVLFSAASIWEIAIKARLRRPDFAVDPRAIIAMALETGFVELPVSANVTALVADLPLHHRDPFDRILVAQAIAEPARLYTADPALAPYSELVTMIGEQCA